jgi:hypothetical protein
MGVCWLSAPLAQAQEKPDSADDRATADEKSQKGTRKAAKPEVDAEVVKEEEGVKTFKFEAVEVEGRLKAPQILYFLRRVRAEFRAGLLGHRSFLPELSDTRRSPALR